MARDSHAHDTRGRWLATAVAAVTTMAGLLVLAQPNEAVRNQEATRAFDLTRPDDVFFHHLNSYTAAASSRRIVTLVALYNAWMNNGEEGWSLNPFNPRNNVNPETDALSSGECVHTRAGEGRGRRSLHAHTAGSFETSG